MISSFCANINIWDNYSKFELTSLTNLSFPLKTTWQETNITRIYILCDDYNETLIDRFPRLKTSFNYFYELQIFNDSLKIIIHWILEKPTH